jgi:hypothetical protein
MECDTERFVVGLTIRDPRQIARISSEARSAIQAILLIGAVLRRLQKDGACANENSCN